MTSTASQPGPVPGDSPNILALLDYDGTLTVHENMEVVLQRFAGDAWRPFEKEVRAGRLSHAECLRRQVALVQAPRAKFLGALADAAEPAPGLAEFFAALAERGGRAAIVSAGFREAIEGFWRRERLPPVDIYASELVGDGPGGEPPYRVAFSDALGDCDVCGPASCKAAVLRTLRRPGDVVLMFGDGASDLCPAREADLTFARSHLAERCAAEGLPWRPLPEFTRVWAEVDEWLRSRPPQRP
jgi:2-hydroxy-3-keto-5-methylthiopentenyl-1-phosphate phosphatase